MCYAEYEWDTKAYHPFDDTWICQLSVDFTRLWIILEHFNHLDDQKVVWDQKHDRCKNQGLQEARVIPQCENDYDSIHKLLILFKVLCLNFFWQETPIVQTRC